MGPDGAPAVRRLCVGPPTAKGLRDRGARRVDSALGDARGPGHGRLMATLDLLIERGWLMAWWMVIPAAAMAGVWVLAIFGDREETAAASEPS